MKTKGLVVITGGFRGIGNALAKVINDNSYTVVITSRGITFSENTIVDGEINKQYLDVCDHSSILRFFEWIGLQKIELIALINNAGVGVFKEMVNLTYEELTSVVNTNLVGAFLCTQYSCKLMQKHSIGGRIINIGSIVELDRIPMNSIYSATKAGLRAMSNVLNEEVNTHRITSTHVALGAVYSDIWNHREGFNANDMLDINVVIQAIYNIFTLPNNVRVDYLEIAPPKRIL